MKIITITSLFPNGKEPNRGIFVLNRLKALNKYADLEVIAPVKWFPFRDKKIPFKEEIDRISVYHPRFFSIPMFFKFLDGLFFSISLRRFRKKIKQADIIDAHFAWPDGYGAWLIAKKYNKKFSVTLRGKDITYWTKRRFIEFKIKKMLDGVDTVISVSNNLKEMVKKRSTKVIPNGVDTNMFKPLNQIISRRKLNLGLTKKIFLTVGNDFKRKGYSELIKSFDKLNIKNKLLLIVGYDQNEFKNLRNKINSLKSRNKIKLVGEINNKKLPVYYSSADIYCLVSYSEGWPNSVMEALACGKPCVVTKEAAGEFITEDLGIITEYWNLTENLEKALNNKWDTKKILEFARENSWDRCAREVYGLFKQLNEK